MCVGGVGGGWKEARKKKQIIHTAHHLFFPHPRLACLELLQVRAGEGLCKVVGRPEGQAVLREREGHQRGTAGANAQCPEERRLPLSLRMSHSQRRLKVIFLADDVVVLVVVLVVVVVDLVRLRVRERDDGSQRFD